MNTTLAALIVFGCLVGAILLGRALRRLLPEDHLTADPMSYAGAARRAWRR